MVKKIDCLDKLENELYGLEAQEKKLRTVLSEFCVSSKGASCVLSGRRGTGKSALVDALLLEYFTDGEIVREDGDLCTNANQKSQKLAELGLIDEEDDKNSKKRQRLVFVIDHFEIFTSKKSQSFLYTLLNGTHQFPWLVILIGSSQDCVSVPPLEKRVYSRLSKSIISFNARYTEEHMLDAFLQFLDCFNGLVELKNVFDVQRDVWKQSLSSFFRRCAGLSQLKKMVALFALLRPLRTIHETLKETLEFCSSSVCLEDEAIQLLNDLPLRQLCLLYCFVKLQKTQNKLEMLCRDLVIEYKRFVNTHKIHLLEVEDEALYKDIEELISAAAINSRSVSDIGELQFKKVSLNVEEESLIRCFREQRHLPIGVANWLDI